MNIIICEVFHIELLIVLLACLFFAGTMALGAWMVHGGINIHINYTYSEPPVAVPLTEAEQKEVDKYNDEQRKVIDAAQAVQELFFGFTESPKEGDEQ